MMRCISAGLIIVALGLAPAQASITFVETFEGGTNVGAWDFGANTFTDPAGGNPGAFRHVTELDTYAPQPSTTGQSIFTGNYRVKGVSSIGVDLKTFYVDFSAEGRPLSPVLINDNLTPNDPEDDWGAYLLGPQNVPLPGQGWLSYDFAIDSQSATLPAGWTFIQFGPNSPTPDWNRLVSNVSRLEYFYGNPEYFFIFQMWELGLDNARITYVPEPAGMILALLGLLAVRRR